VVADTCSATDFEVVREFNENRKEVVDHIVSTILPPTASSSDGTIEGAFEAIAIEFGVEQTQETLNRFSEAVSEVAAAEVTACSSSSPPSSSDVPNIAREFIEKLSRGPRTRDIEGIRTLYGTMVCISKREEERKRRDSVECPPGGIPAVETTEEFFCCLGSGELEPVFGLDAVAAYYPCVAFVIDTTGSMAGEIADVKNVLLEFVRNERDSAGCYILVPFNDVDNDVTKSEYII